MKTYILILSLVLAMSHADARGKKKKKTTPKKNKAVANIITSLEVKEFIDHVNQIKKYKSVDQVKQKNYKMKKFFSNKKLWHYFDTDNFEKGLERRLKKNFSLDELQRLNKYIKQPFVSKVLSSSILHRDLFTFNKNSLSELYTPEKIQKSRYILIENLFNLHGMEIQQENLEKKLKRLVRSGKVNIKVLTKNKKNEIFVDPKKLENRLKNSKDFIVKHFASELTQFRHYEIRDYFRRCRKSRLMQRFVQLYANYHFIYMMKYIDKVEQDKLDELKALQVVK